MNLFENVMILQRELCLLSFHIIYWLLYDPGGGTFASSHFPHRGEFANFIKKKYKFPGVSPGGMGTGGIDWCIMAIHLATQTKRLSSVIQKAVTKTNCSFGLQFVFAALPRLWFVSDQRHKILEISLRNSIWYDKNRLPLTKFNRGEVNRGISSSPLVLIHSKKLDQKG